MEQQADSDIGPIITSINNKTHLQYVAKEEDCSGMRVLLKYWKELMMKEGLLYRKALLKGHDQPIALFALPKSFRCKTVLACHDDFGHMGMDRTLGLIKDFSGQKCWQIAKDVCFKMPQERVEMKTITASYPLELIHLDFLMIDTKNDSNKNVSVFVVTDHFTRYAAAYVMPKQTASIVAKVLWDNF